MNFSKIKNHLIVVVVGILMICVYYKPIFDGKVLQQSDVIQARAMQHEILDYKAKTGHHAMWLNNLFSGMPAYMVSPDYSTSFVPYLLSPIETFFKGPMSYTLYYFLGFYMLLIVLGFNPWLSGIGAIMFTFSSYNIIIMEAGHTTKARCIAFMPFIMSGLIMLFQRKYIWGAIVSGLFLTFSIRSNHPQIVYYMFMMIALYFVYQLVEAIRTKELKHYFIATSIFAASVLLAIASNYSQLLVTYEYAKDTMRGGSELASGNTTSNKSIKGLDKDYAFSWSYGKMESITLLIPNAFGGSTGGTLDESSKVYSALTEAGVPESNAADYAKQIPTYWGPKPFTSGPVYLGAIVCFLFLLGIFLVKDNWRWWIYSTTILALMLAWGKNFSTFNYFFFDHVPFYNKFRTVEMILVLCQFTFPFLAMMTLKKILDGEIKKEELISKLKISTIIIGAILLLFAVLPSLFLDFNGNGDESLKNELLNAFGRGGNEAAAKPIVQKILAALKLDREHMAMMDAWRSLIFVLLVAGVLWAYAMEKLKANVVMIIVGLAVLVDLWGVDKRFLNDDKFMDADNMENNYTESAADVQILQDKSVSYRIFDVATNPFNDAIPSYHHKNIGGYNPAKLSRYQDLIDSCIGRNNMSVINMLNTKYFIVKGQNGQEGVQQNPQAMGNAWMVDTLKLVNSPREEIMALKNFNPQTTAILDASKFKNATAKTVFEKDSTAKITLTANKNNLDELEYNYHSAKDQLTVFSEVYYADDKGKGWQAYLDGKPVEHFRVNYILRAMVVPAGNHTIVFKFEPKDFINGQRISFMGSILLSCLILFGLVMWWMQQRKIVANTTVQADTTKSKK